MPVILHRADYERWIGTDPDPCDLLRPSASEALRIWPISTRVNKRDNDDASILDEVPAQAMEGI
jgi:putative SOS response-associated peptidase YedK